MSVHQGIEPNCPKCKGSMVLRKAKKGPNAGGDFWGCSKFPKCRGTVSLDQKSDSAPSSAASFDDLLPAIEWRENFARPGWISQYEMVSSVPSYLLHMADLQSAEIHRLTGHTAFYRRTEAPLNNIPEGWAFIAQAIKKILQRGEAPLPTIEVEKQSIAVAGLAEDIRPTQDQADLSHEALRPRHSVNPSAVSALLGRRRSFEFSAEEFPVTGSGAGGLDSTREEQFLAAIAPRLWPRAGHFIHPQAPLSVISRSQDDGHQRCDFFYAAPHEKAVVIEIDGDDHASAHSVDAQRDSDLADGGVTVIRIPNKVIDSEDESYLKSHISISDHSEGIESNSSEESLATALRFCSDSAKIQFCIAQAMEQGLLLPDSHWEIHVTGSGFDFEAAITDVVHCIKALSDVFNLALAPKSVTINEGHDGVDTESVLRIEINTDAGPLHSFKDAIANRADYVVRSPSP